MHLNQRSTALHTHTLRTYITKCIECAVMALCITAASLSHAKPSLDTPSTTRSPKNLAEEAAATGATTIRATADAPMVSNIVGWKDLSSSLEKNAIEFSALQDSLTLTDRDQLKEETRYSRILNQTSNQPTNP